MKQGYSNVVPTIPLVLISSAFGLIAISIGIILCFHYYRRRHDIPVRGNVVVGPSVGIAPVGEYIIMYTTYQLRIFLLGYVGYGGPIMYGGVVDYPVGYCGNDVTVVTGMDYGGLSVGYGDVDYGGMSVGYGGDCGMSIGYDGGDFGGGGFSYGD